MAGAQAAQADQRLLPPALLRPWLLIVVGLAAASLVQAAVKRSLSISEVYLLSQDSLALVLTAVFLFALGEVRVGPGPGRLPPVSAWPAPVIVAGAAALVVAVGALGWGVVFQRYPLSMDEFWATFDAGVFRRGALMAAVPPPWRSYAPALQPMWRMEVRGGAFWASTYLPVNAAWRALFDRFGVAALANPCLAGLSCAMVFALARRLWPQRRDAAVVAVLLLATSSQLLVTAMTPYAMSAHLALNLVWLWLFLRERWWSRLAAVAVGFAACGIHQLIFHPLFVAPFILELWLVRRWRPAAFYTLAYVAICLFWITYWSLVLKVSGALPAAAGGVGGGQFLERAAALIRAFNPAGVGDMAENLLRFVAWQNPLMIALGAAGLPLALRSRGPLRPLAVGLGLTILAMTVLLPSQGHGWGYRYLHGLLGGVALIAAEGWVAMTAPGRIGEWRRAGGTFALASVFAVAVMLPLRAVQAHRFVHPYASAFAAIRATPADVVVVDPTGLWYGQDLVRNDPWLTQGPQVLHIGLLTPASLLELCRHGRVALFDQRQGRALGVPTFADSAYPARARLRQLLTEAPACGGAPAARP